MTEQGIRPELFSRGDLRRLILPLICEQALAVCVGMADTVMVASLGQSVVAGVSLVDMINNLVINLFAALATGGAVVASQLIGAGRRREAAESGSQLLFAATVFGLLLMGIALALNAQILRLFFGGIEPDVMAAASEYLYYTALSFPFLAVYNACAALFRSMGNSRVSMYVSLGGNLLNVAGNAVLLFGFGMGVAGAAIPTVVSRFLMMTVLLYLLTRPQVMLRPAGRFRPDIRLLGRILGIGIPSGVENSLFQLGRILVVSLITSFGTVQIAANAVANNIDGVGCIIGQAFNLAMLTVIGRAVGAQDEGAVRGYLRRLMRMEYSIHVPFEILTLVTLPLTVGLYGLPEETAQLSMLLVLIHNGSALFLWPLAFTFPNALRATNDVRYTMVISVFSMAAFRICLSYVFGSMWGMGAVGVWIAMVVDWCFRTLFFLLRWWGNRWREKAGFSGERIPARPV